MGASLPKKPGASAPTTPEEGTDTLRTLRILAGLTQLGLAASLGVHRTTVARWETGKLPIPRWVELAMRSL